MREGSTLPSGTVTFLFTDIERSTENDRFRPLRSPVTYPIYLK